MAETDRFLTVLEPQRKEITELLGDLTEPDKMRFVALACRAVTDPKFDKCTDRSKLDCIIQAATCRLELGTPDHLAFLIPYGDQVTFQPSYLGKIKRLIDAGAAAKIFAELVYEYDDWKEDAAARRLEHRPKRFGLRGALVGAYALAVLPSGDVDYEVLVQADIEAIKKASERMADRHRPQSERGQLSPAWRFFEGEMIKKSAIHRLAKRLQGDRSRSDAINRLHATVDAEARLFDFNDLREAEHDTSLPDPPTRKVNPDEVLKPAGGEGRRRERGSSLKPPGDTRPASAPPSAPDPDSPISMVELDGLVQIADTLNLTLGVIRDTLIKVAGVRTFEQLKSSQVETVAKALQQAVEDQK